jgi:hypothetical protein
VPGCRGTAFFIVTAPRVNRPTTGRWGCSPPLPPLEIENPSPQLDALLQREPGTIEQRPHEALQTAGTICRFVFHRRGRRIKSVRTAWANACVATGFPGRIPHDLRRFAIRNWSGPACRAPSRCSSPDTDRSGVSSLRDYIRSRPQRGRRETQCTRIGSADRQRR